MYISPDHKIELMVNLDNEAVWLSQDQPAVLFDILDALISFLFTICVYADKKEYAKFTDA
jgi:hypothetical protein